MNQEQKEKLDRFFVENKVTSKGKLAVVLYVGRLTTDVSYPLDSRDYLAESNGQIRGLGREAVQRILQDYGISRVLAEEGGRTSRGSIGLMEKYLEFLNTERFDLEEREEIEIFWIQKINDFFSSKPIYLSTDSSLSSAAIFRDLVEKAKKKQLENPGTKYLGAILQHMVGAKFRHIYPDLRIDMNGFSVSDASSSRQGDFEINETIIHVTSLPSEALARKCKSNLDSNKNSLIITTTDGLPFASRLLEEVGIEKRVDVIDFVQFMTSNVLERTDLVRVNRSEYLRKVIETYNDIIHSCESDPSLMIELD